MSANEVNNDIDIEELYQTALLEAGTTTNPGRWLFLEGLNQGMKIAGRIFVEPKPIEPAGDMEHTNPSVNP